MPPREEKRLKLRCSFERFKLDETHPPTTYRIQFMQSQNLNGSFSIDQIRAKNIIKELESMKKEIHEKAVEDYRYYYLLS